MKQQRMPIAARFTAWLAIIFVCAQVLGTAHAATYGKGDHLHNGHPCIVASIVKKSADMDVAPAPHFDLAEHSEWFEASPIETAPISRITRTGTIRAPPAHA